MPQMKQACLILRWVIHKLDLEEQEREQEREQEEQKQRYQVGEVMLPFV
jgi:hypothetical protein